MLVWHTVKRFERGHTLGSAFNGDEESEDVVLAGVAQVLNRQHHAVRENAGSVLLSDIK